MKILAMDTSAAACSVAVWQNDTVTHHNFQEMARGHASELMPMIASLLQDASLEISDFDALAVTVGPGAFTGLRISLAAARGFAAASGLPVIGVTTLEALSHGAGEVSIPVLCALDAKRADLYAQVFDGHGNPTTQAVARLPEDVVNLFSGEKGKVLIVGDSFDRVKDILLDQGYQPEQSDLRLPDARHVAEVAAQKGLPVGEEARPSAFYIRPPDAALPKNGGRLRP